MPYINNNSDFESKWHRLDNTANIFPGISNKNFSSVYRIYVRLKQEIKPEILKAALDKTLPYFDNFRVKLRRGLFWYYFEANKKHPVVEEEQFIPCVYIDPSVNNHFLFKVKYFKKRISLEVFHVITDGNGAVNFLKELTYNYIKIANQADLISDLPETPNAKTNSNIEDSYVKNYEKSRMSPYTTKKAYHFETEKLPIFAVNVIHGYINRQKLLDVCAQNNASITQYLTAVLIWCIYDLYGRTQNKPIQVTIPVNLRSFFESTTMMNFFSFVFIRQSMDKSNYTFDEILEITKSQFKEQLTKENLSKKISYNVAPQKNIFVRFTPLFLKNLLLKYTYVNSTKANTTTVTNLGKIDVENEYKDYIEDFGVLLSATTSEPFKCTACSFNEKFVISFTSRLKSTDLQCAFFRELSSHGLEIVIESNGINNEKL